MTDRESWWPVAEITEQPVAAVLCAWPECMEPLRVPVQVDLVPTAPGDPGYNADLEGEYQQFTMVVQPNLGVVWMHVFEKHSPWLTDTERGQLLRQCSCPPLHIGERPPDRHWDDCPQRLVCRGPHVKPVLWPCPQADEAHGHEPITKVQWHLPIRQADLSG